MIEAVIFDCDGILVDSEPLHYRAFMEVLSPLGLDFDYSEYLARYIGFDDRDAFVEVFRENERELDSGVLQGLIAAKGEALREIVSRGISGFPGVVELVRNLGAHEVPLAVASGAMRHEVEWFIEALGLYGAFRVVVAADEVHRSKPDPETYLLALERLGEGLGGVRPDPSICIAIEDTPAGIRSAKAAGLYTVGVGNSFPLDRLTEADLVVKSLEELDYARMAQLLERGGK